MAEEHEFWAERVAKEIAAEKRKQYVCEGGWSPSGYFHLGNARPEIFTPHAVYLKLRALGLKSTQILVVDDFDPIDKIPAGIPVPKEKEPDFIGKPYYLAESPFRGFNSWSHYFLSEVTDVIEDFGVDVKFVSSYESYKSGERNEWIGFSLDRAKEIVETWNKIAGADKPKSFLPVTMLCQGCGKIMFTEATGWDGKEVSYKCKECGFEGANSPFDGNSKLHWRVHWVVNWLLNDVVFESGGKDHFSKGGSVDVGKALAKEVFKKKPPVLVPTEFLQLKGTKMSGSAGNVFGLKQWLEVASPELFRFLFFSYKANSAIDFSLADNSFILLNERFERAERVFFGEEVAENNRVAKNLKNSYEMAAIGKPAKKMPLQVPYSFAVQLSQIMDPGQKFREILEVLKQTGHVTGTVSREEEKTLKAELRRAKAWAEKYAPEDFKLSFLEKLSEKERSEMDSGARKLLPKVAEAVSREKSADKMQQAIFETAKSSNVKPRALFQAIYLALIGKDSGPKAGLLVLALGKEKCIKRLKEAA